MVTRNLEGPENEKIELTEFYLDTLTYSQKKAMNKIESKKLETYLTAQIEAQNKVSEHLQKHYLDPMDVKGIIIRGIFQTTMATSYTLLPPIPANIQRLKWIEELRKVQKFLALLGKFEPWIRMTKE